MTGSAVARPSAARGMLAALRRIPSWVLPLVLAGLLAAGPYLGVDRLWTRQIVLTAIMALVISGINLSFGYAGELALGHVAMYAAGAYVGGVMTVWGYDMAVAVPVAALSAVVVGFVSGAPGLRLGGWGLAMASFFLVLLVPDVVQIFEEQTGGFAGLAGVPLPTLFGEVLTPNGFYLVTIACLVGWFAVMRNVVVSRHGGALRVLRQSTVLASSLGINSNRTKLTVYMLGSVPAGIAGCLFVLLDSFVTPDYFVLALAIAFIAGSVLGGSESVYGALVGAAIIQILLGRTTVFAEYALVAYGVLLVLGGVLLAGGITGLVRHGMATVVRRIEPEPDTEVDGTLTPTVPPQGPVVIGADDDVQVPGEDLQVEAIAKRFGGVQALDDVTLRARAGTVTALIGANGSGKTTLVNIISGFYRPNSGTVALGGRRIDGQRPHRVSRRGVARTFQTPMIPKSMTTLEVVASARYARDYVGILAAVLRLPSFRRRRRADLEMSIAALETLGIAHLAHHPATALPLGSRRLVEMARALVARPAVLLLDEPASGLDEREVQHLGVVLRRLAEAGATVLLIEHNFQFVCDVSDHMYVLEFGRLIAEGSPDAVREDPAVIRSYLGQLADGASGESVEEAIHEGAVAAGTEETR